MHKVASKNFNSRFLLSLSFVQWMFSVLWLWSLVIVMNQGF
jgi:hypothetical protein